jgi:hypothetical protein
MMKWIHRNNLSKKYVFDKNNEHLKTNDSSENRNPTLVINPN